MSKENEDYNPIVNLPDINMQLDVSIMKSVSVVDGEDVLDINCCGGSDSDGNSCNLNVPTAKSAALFLNYRDDECEVVYFKKEKDAMNAYDRITDARSDWEGQVSEFRREKMQAKGQDGLGF